MTWYDIYLDAYDNIEAFNPQMSPEEVDKAAWAEAAWITHQLMKDGVPPICQ